MNLQAVIFDFDGVIGLTMEDNFTAWVRAFAPYDIRIQREEYFLLEGLNTKRVAEKILNSHGLDCMLAHQIAHEKERHYLSNNSFAFYPGALDVVSELGKNYSLGVVSGAGKARLSQSVPAAFIDQFQVVVYGDSVTNSKPHPEPYIKAANDLNISPSKCIAVENAPLGIMSAKKAGMVCAAVCSTLSEEYLNEADYTLRTISELPHIINQIAISLT